MPRYLVERRFDPISEADMMALATRGKAVLEARFPEVRWEHSHVVADVDGTIRSYCVYDSPDEERLRRHAELMGQHMITSMQEIIGDIDPIKL